jgi:hypothetical protein
VSETEPHDRVNAYAVRITFIVVSTVLACGGRPNRCKPALTGNSSAHQPVQTVECPKKLDTDVGPR